jgi:hypothetical protein
MSIEGGRLLTFVLSSVEKKERKGEGRQIGND